MSLKKHRYPFFHRKKLIFVKVFCYRYMNTNDTYICVIDIFKCSFEENIQNTNAQTIRYRIRISTVLYD